MHDDMSDADMKAIALNMWANHIETGHVGMSARDVHQQVDVVRTRPEEFRRLGFSLKVLKPEQEALVVRLRALSNAVEAERGRESLSEGSFRRECYR